MCNPKICPFLQFAGVHTGQPYCFKRKCNIARREEVYEDFSDTTKLKNSWPVWPFMRPEEKVNEFRKLIMSSCQL